MNIIECIKSKKSFHRKRRDGVDLWISQYDLETIYLISFLEIIADDWEIEEEKVEMTRTEFFKASEVAAQKTAHRLGSMEPFTFALARALGFKE